MLRFHHKLVSFLLMRKAHVNVREIKIIIRSCFSIERKKQKS